MLYPSKKCQRCMPWSVLRRCEIHLLSHMKVQKRLKRNKLTMLKLQYEMFAIEDHESIQSMISRLQVILNSLRSLGSTVSQYEINDKILIILPAKW